MNVKSRQQENAEATREALLESALSAFIEHGYGGVSIDAIAREARVTKGAFYHHFGSKQELLAECYERQVRTIAEDLDKVPAHVDKWAEAAALAEAFIDSVMARGKRQLSLQEVITVVGWERWKRIDSPHAALRRAPGGRTGGQWRTQGLPPGNPGRPALRLPYPGRDESSRCTQQAASGQ